MQKTSSLKGKKKLKKEWLLLICEEEKIINIEEVCGLSVEDYGQMDGYKVTTTKHTYYVLIDNFQQCCEHFGYFVSEDDPNQFVGANLLEIRLTDTALNNKKLEEYGINYEYAMIQFVDFVTDKGVFQIAVYNEHNGYYGHDIVILKDNVVWFGKIL